MAIDFPTDLDDFTSPADTDDLDTSGVFHDFQHADANDAIEAVEAKVGVDGSAVTTSLDYRIATLEAAGPWAQVVNEVGTSFTNFTAASGTWSSDGTVIKQTDTAAAFRRAKYNSFIVTGLLVLEAEIQLRSTGTDHIGGIVVGFDGSNAGGIAARLNEGADQLQVEVDATSGRITPAATINSNTWYKVRLVVGGGVASAYLDGTLLGSAGNNAQQSNNAGYVGLLTYQSEVWFRNIKAWNLNLPA
jgi:hypothetical protein